MIIKQNKILWKDLIQLKMDLTNKYDLKYFQMKIQTFIIFFTKVDLSVQRQVLRKHIKWHCVRITPI